MRILAVDPGTKNMGIALSDGNAGISRPFSVLKSISHKENACKIVNLAHELGVTRIVIGQSVSEEGEITSQTRKSINLMKAIESITDLEVVLWDEWGSTQDARAIKIHDGSGRKKRAGHHDALAAALILQDYLDSLCFKERNDAA